MRLTQKPSSAIKALLDRKFSTFIKLRDSHEQGSFPYVRCCTCGAFASWQAMDAGHYISRMVSITRWHPKNCHAQCYKCNRLNSGEREKYRKFLVNKYGDDAVVELENFKKSWKSGAILSMSKQDLIEAVEEYTAKIKELKRA